MLMKATRVTHRDQVKLRQERRRSLSLHMLLLSHAARCKDEACPSSNCAMMKKVLRHKEECKVGPTSGCSTCHRIWSLIRLHTYHCGHSHSCHMPHCQEIGQGQQQLRSCHILSQEHDDSKENTQATTAMTEAITT